jgi:hypothetical protein
MENTKRILDIQFPSKKICQYINQKGYLYDLGFKLDWKNQVLDKNYNKHLHT